MHLIYFSDNFSSLRDILPSPTFSNTGVTLMLQTHSMEKRVRVCQMWPRAGIEPLAEYSISAREFTSLSEADLLVSDGALSRERWEIFCRCPFASNTGLIRSFFAIHLLVRSLIMSVSLNRSDSGLTIQDLYPDYVWNNRPI